MRGELTEHIPAPHRTCRFLENWLQVSFLETISWPAPSYVSDNFQEIWVFLVTWGSGLGSCRPA